MSEHKYPSIKPWLGIALLVLVLDQISKVWIVQGYALYQGFEVTSFFNIIRVHNEGAAFSFLSNAGGWQRWLFTAIAVAASVAIVWLLKTSTQRPRAALALSLILGGAVGNLVDRVIYGYVVDFLDFHWQFLSLLFHGGHFPAFNIADSGITVGAALLIWDELRK